MQQNIIAVIWDFDKTLIRGYMQKPLFKKYDVEESDFWKEVNQLYVRYKEMDIKVNKDTIYLNHLITCTSQGIFRGLNNDILRELGKELEFYDGIPEFFEVLTNMVVKDDRYRKHDIKLEHYIVSTGLTEVIKGSKIYKYVKGIWGCEFIENPIKSEIEIKEYRKEEVNDNRVITQIGFAIDNTSKTRAIFEINKGVNLFNEIIDVNSKVPKDSRRIPIENMIYIADGPSDVPVFSLLKQNNGSTFAVYEQNNEKEFEQVEQLRKDGRVDMYGEANYSHGTQTYMWISKQVKNVADNIYVRLENEVINSASIPPKHLTD